MINIYQIQLTDEQIDAVNANERVPAFNARSEASIGRFRPSCFQYYTLACKVATDDLEVAFRLTNLWENPELVTNVSGRTHSSSVGDIFEVVKYPWQSGNGEFYMCSPMGFKKIEEPEKLYSPISTDDVAVAPTYNERINSAITRVQGQV
jgi:hypothetical protein